MKKIKKILIVLFIVVVVLFIALNIYASNPYEAHDEMFGALEVIKSDTVTFYEDKDELRFTIENPLKNIVFIPGGLVEPNVYQYLGYSLALEGYNVTIAKAPYNLAIFNQSIGKKFLSDDLENIVIGHSLGGVTASMVFSGNDAVSTLIFLGSYPVKDLQDKTTLFLDAEFDLGMDPDAFQNSLKYVNDENTIISIEGGNHAQFGWYGPQKGDGVATIDNLTQQKIVVNYIVQFLEE